MPYCGECGKKYKDSLKFCPHCGTPNPLNNKGNKPDSNKKEEKNNKKSNKTIKRDSSLYGRVNLEDLPKGYIIDERYDVKEKLGQGGFGAVYLVYDQKMEIEKALKVIPQAITNDEEAMLDLQRESRTMISLNHPNIVRVYDFHDEGKIKYIDMEYVDGKTLTRMKIEQSNKQMPEDEVKEYAIKIAEGLAYAHSKNVIHKDIKPQNVMITKDNQVKIMDFGIAETVRTSMSRLKNSTSSGTLVYMSPEQLLGENVGKESDIYSFGAMIYELLSGQPPFYKGAVEHQVLNKKPKPLDFISDNLNKLIMRCLEKDYKDRFKDFTEVERFLEKEGVTEDGNKSKDDEEKDADYGDRISEDRERKSDENGEKKKESEEDEHEVGDDQEDEDGEEFDEEDKPERPEKPIEEKVNKKIRKGMVFVEGGTFNMGSDEGREDEKPVHAVTLSSFYISKYPVTQKEWKKVMGNNLSHFVKRTGFLGLGEKHDLEMHPVETISWYDAVKFCNKKSEMEGLEKCYIGKGKNIRCNFSKNGYRLPTEAEWEYAARGGVESDNENYRYAGSNDIDRVAWYSGNSDSKTHQVGQKKANKLGIYDMSGNVWEWCWDWYDRDYYEKGPCSNPTGPNNGEFRILRGGSWFYENLNCPVAYRGYNNPFYSNPDDGFRLAKSMEQCKK